MSEASLRKQRSVNVLMARGIPVLDSLPEIETAAEVTIRSGPEIVRRAMCLFAVSNAAIKNDLSLGQAYVRKHNLSAALSPDETDFLSGQSVSEADAIIFGWRVEAAIPLMWAFGVYPELWFPDDEVNVLDVFDYWLGFNHPDISRIGHRDPSEILDQADLIYRLHWAVRQARLDQTDPAAGLHPSVVAERHHALNWLISYEGDDWDDVQTDT